jgi:hypothetical protein
MDNSTRETDVHDLSLSVIHALAMVDAKVLSYVQLRRLYAALVHAIEFVNGELAVRTNELRIGDTARFERPKSSDND